MTRLCSAVGLAPWVARARSEANVAGRAPAPPPLPVSANSTSLPLPTRSMPKPTDTPCAGNVRLPLPPVETEPAQLSVPEPLAVADTGAFVIGVPFSVPEQVPLPLKL